LVGYGLQRRGIPTPHRESSILELIFLVVFSRIIHITASKGSMMSAPERRGGATNSIMGVQNNEFASEASEKHFFVPNSYKLGVHDACNA